MTERLGWGLIGLGEIVRGTIAPALAAQESCDLVAVVSRDQGRAEGFADEFGARFAYTDLEDMLANPAVEAVFVATPNALHAAQVVAAARAGKHVLCEKPLATSMPDARGAVAACAEAGVHLGINFHNRFAPWVTDVGRMIGEGAIGRIELIQVEVGSGKRTYTNWRADPGMAGLGSLYNVGVHALDFLGHVLDSQPVEVTALFDETPGSGSVEMLAVVLARFENGALAYLNCNERIAFPRNDITIYGTTGRIVGHGLTRARQGGHVQVFTAAGESSTEYPAPAAHQASVAGFTASIMEGRPPVPSGLDGLRSMLVCDAIVRSVIERRLVTVESVRP